VWGDALRLCGGVDGHPAGQIAPRPGELELRVNSKALTDLLATLVRRDSQVMASYGVPGLRYRYERQPLVLRQAGRGGRIVLSRVPQQVWSSVLNYLEQGVPPRSRLLFTGSDAWTQDEINYQEADEHQKEGSASYLSALFRRPGLLGDQELRICLDRGREEAVADGAGRPLRPWCGPSTPVELDSDGAEKAEDADEAGHVLGRGLLQEIVRSALERDENLGGWRDPASGELFALADPGQLDPGTASQLQEDIAAVITERDGLLRELPFAGESGDYLRITAGEHLVPLEPFTCHERDAAAAWPVPLDFNYRTEAAPPVIAITLGVQLHLLDLLGLEPTHPRWPET
jgi:hypothetical protein